MEVGRPKPDHVRIVELRHLDPARVPLDSVPHPEIEEALDERPMTLACGDITQARQGKGKRGKEGRNGEAEQGRKDFDAGLQEDLP